MARKILRNLSHKSIFNYGGVNWIVLDNEFDGMCRPNGFYGIFCISESILFDKAFDEENNNNWVKSSLRKYLNGDFLEQLIINGANKIDFVSMKFRLPCSNIANIATDGNSCEDKIGLISYENYLIYKEDIKKVDKLYLASQPCYSIGSNTYDINNINPEGWYLTPSAPYRKTGVRPVCKLNLETLVTINLDELIN